MPTKVAPLVFRHLLRMHGQASSYSTQAKRRGNPPQRIVRTSKRGPLGGRVMSARDLLNLAWICMRRSIETDDERLSDELDRLAGGYVAEARKLDPSLMEIYSPSSARMH